jgi:predicted transcriptional regulator
MSIRIELPDELTADVRRRAERAGQTPGEFIVEAVRRQLALERFRETRERLAPYGKAAGLDTDEAVFAAIS